jgi:hypothetical protein
MAKVMISEYWDHGKKKAIRTYSIHDSLYAPFILDIGSEKYIMPGWYKLDKHEYNIKKEDIKFYPYRPKEDNKPNIDKDSIYKVMSSKGDKEYIVKADISGSLECTCVGYEFRRRCRHIDQIKDSL